MARARFVNGKHTVDAFKFQFNVATEPRNVPRAQCEYVNFLSSNSISNKSNNNMLIKREEN